MAVIGLSLYTFRMLHTDKTKKPQEKQYANLNNSIGEEDNIFKVFERFCNEYSYKKDRIRSTAFKVCDSTLYSCNDTGKRFRHMMLHVEYGESGYTAPVVDDETGEEKYTKKANEAAMSKLNISILVDVDKQHKNIKKGFIIFQSLGNTSVKSQFEKNFKDFLSKKYKTDDYKYTFCIDQVVPKNFVKNLLEQNTLKKIELISYKKPEDPVEEIDEDFAYGVEKRSFSQIRGVSKVVKKIHKYLDAQGKLTDIVEVSDFEYDDIKLEIAVGSRKRMIDIGKVDNTQIKISLPEEIKNLEGHADINKLKGEVEDLYCLYSENVRLDE